MEFVLMCTFIVWLSCVLVFASFVFLLYLLYRWLTWCPIKEVKHGA
ncbi:hypothetical protein [Clostridium sp. AN503]